MTLVFNPYATADFGGVQIDSLSHWHSNTGGGLLTTPGVLASGYKHVAISNYHPENPLGSYPLWNLSTIDEEDIPADVLAAPNAEHHQITNAGGHFTSIGSELVVTPQVGTTGGYYGPWKSLTDDVVANLRWPGKGGLIANHPWFNNALRPPLATMKQWLDYSESMLGIEIYNHFCEHRFEQPAGWALDLWHWLLVSGRRCFGYASLDHWRPDTGSPHPIGNDEYANMPLGRNTLILPTGFDALSRAEREEICVSAYSSGHTVASLDQTTLKLTNLTASDTQVTVTFSETCEIIFYWGEPGDQNPRSTEMVSNTTATFDVPENAVYVRAEGKKATYERLFTQAVMYMTKEEVDAANGGDHETVLDDEDAMLLMMTHCMCPH